ncbi:MAG TPA: MBL fold metallo-hydrolase [Candidatus Angelobacter sp.]|nr:MBL fold metallo-hydrolase [Candidatus Angelobacter sp.]
MLQTMAVRMAVLASGSRGNCAVLSSSAGSILVDAGLSWRETLRRMKIAGEDPCHLKAIVISHEHADHVAGLQVLARRLKLPVYMTEATYESWRRSARDPEGKPARLEQREHFHAGRSFSIGNITVNPFTIPHDAADPCGFTFRAEGVKIGLVTDLGYLPNNVKHHLRGCDGLLLESNHDLEMLRNGPYPWMVKQRVMSRVGHLSNSALAEFLSSDYDGGAAFLVLAHLSEQNNYPELARQTAYKALGNRLNLFQSSALTIAHQDKPLQPLCLG